MFCPNCGKQIPDSARVCGFCGYRQGAAFQQPYLQPPPQQPVPIIVQTKSSGGLLSGCGGLLNSILTAALLAVIGAFVLFFLCVLRLPSAFPLINLPAPAADLWSRAIAWQGASCGSRTALSVNNPAPADNPVDGGNTQGENAGATACNRSKFAYETIPDHTVFKPGEKFTKTWTVRNDGDCPWTTAFTFGFTQGSRMGGPKSIALDREVKPGETYTFKLDLTAPDAPGTYTGRWEIFDAQANSFGWYSVVIDVGTEGVAPKPKEPTVIVNPSVGKKCTNFNIAISGFAPNEEIILNIGPLDGEKPFGKTLNTDENGKAAYAWNADVTAGGQYIALVDNGNIGGSAVFIIESDDECDCDGVCPTAACSQTKTQGDCEAAGGEWTVVRMQTGPNQYYCNCP